MKDSKSHEGDEGSVVRSKSGRPSYWRTPLLAGGAFCGAQIALFLVRFGFESPTMVPAASSAALAGMLSGLALFFVAGILVGLFARWLLRGTLGAWRKFLIVAISISTPIAVAFSLAGGLLGPPFVVVYALLPYLLLAGVPALGRRAWLWALAHGIRVEPANG